MLLLLLRQVDFCNIYRPLTPTHISYFAGSFADSPKYHGKGAIRYDVKVRGNPYPNPPPQTSKGGSNTSTPTNSITDLANNWVTFWKNIL